jgi:hypothetical protein
MVRGILLVLGLVWGVGCSGAGSEGAGDKAHTEERRRGDRKAKTKKAAHRTQHTQEAGKSLPFTLLVAVDAGAEKALRAKGQTIEVSVTVLDGVGGDEGGFRETRLDLPADGGILEVPAMDLSPVKGGRALTEFSVNVYSKRKGTEPNVINCDYLGGAVGEITGRMNVNCRAL